MDDHEKSTHVPSKILNRKLNFILVVSIFHILIFIGSLVYFFMYY